MDNTKKLTVGIIIYHNNDKNSIPSYEEAKINYIIDDSETNKSEKYKEHYVKNKFTVPKETSLISAISKISNYVDIIGITESSFLYSKDAIDICTDAFQEHIGIVYGDSEQNDSITYRISLVPNNVNLNYFGNTLFISSQAIKKIKFTDIPSLLTQLFSNFVNVHIPLVLTYAKD